jgi:hypothetical protein
MLLATHASWQVFVPQTPLLQVPLQHWRFVEQDKPSGTH